MGTLIADKFKAWKMECEKRFNHLKANEEELNRIFIDLYGLQNEQHADVEDKDVTVRKADLVRDIKSLISYAVGCMFGRYSLDKDGLCYAGGNFADQFVMVKSENSKQDGHKSRYYLREVVNQSDISRLPDNHLGAEVDNIIPITDEAYFADDIVSRFEEFVRIAYGADTFEENVRFVANALGGNGSPQDVIRSYFLNDFYADHLKMYQRRPIYWLFSSGKKNGFKCLIYVHRYQPDTIARIRTDYIHALLLRYQNAVSGIESVMNEVSGCELVSLQKQLKKLRAQMDEINQYEEKINLLADQMISIDLDDGVKANYAKFGDVLAVIK